MLESMGEGEDESGYTEGYERQTGGNDAHRREERASSTHEENGCKEGKKEKDRGAPTGAGACQEEREGGRGGNQGTRGTGRGTHRPGRGATQRRSL